MIFFYTNTVVVFFNQKLKRYFLVAKKSSRERSELELTQVLMSFGAKEFI